ncbi:MAG: hypothetical protein BV457_03475 [Thermoplasmata archaeon M9B1D]|nr:MAG: hypothetical protein BV457_03475 [Thermoplasmata archaeon M9B1D]PNX51248.1 MAG: hypothetical protein BV456_03890 [Thermoplasmata archaeon M8B2D]
MIKHLPNRIFVISIIILLCGTCFIPLYNTESTNQLIAQKPNQNQVQNLNPNNFRILFAPMWYNSTYLLDKYSEMDNIWHSNFYPGVSVDWVGDGTILRTIRLSGAPGGGGGVQRLNWDGTVIWDFRYNTNGVLSHHDIKMLPNGNVLLIAWETKTYDEAIAAGKNPNSTSIGGLMPDHIIEVKPTGPTTGDIVWEWHVWDHLIQDYDPSKANYGIVSEHPELVDVNYITMAQWDLMHTNSIDYNENLDQILLSVCYYNEIWVIDHSTTTAEAASHTGGNSGKGGDILYRWGNPQTYKRGTSSDQKLFLQHDATWIKSGCPGEGDILIYNNGMSSHTSIDEITPPMNKNDEYYIGADSAYGPTETTWNYTDTLINAGQYGGAERLPNGNTLITNGETGYILQVDQEKVRRWSYPSHVQIFKVVYVPPNEQSDEPDLYCYGSLKWSRASSGTTLDGYFYVTNIGANGSLLNWEILSYPDWGTWYFDPDSGERLTPEYGQYNVHVSVIPPKEKNKEFEGYIRIARQENQEDYSLIPVYVKTSRQKTINLSIFKFFENHQTLFQLLQKCLNISG